MRNRHRDNGQYREEDRLNEEFDVIYRAGGKSGRNDCGDKSEEHGCVEAHYRVENEEGGIYAVVTARHEYGKEKHSEGTEEKVGHVGEQTHNHTLLIAGLHSSAVNSYFILSSYLPHRVVNEHEIEASRKYRHEDAKISRERLVLEGSHRGI